MTPSLPPPALPLTVYRAETFIGRLAGLLARPPMACDEALYLAPCAAVHTAFMAYAIDVVFLDREGRILEVVCGLPPWRTARCGRAHAALELRAGQAPRLGMRLGMPTGLCATPSVPGGQRCWSRRGRRAQPPDRSSGASLVECLVVLPLFLFMVLAVMQAALVFHAKSNLNYATFEAARAGTVAHARLSAIKTGFRRGLLAYYGGGRNQQELDEADRQAAADLTDENLRVEILSPTLESFRDYNSPALRAALKVTEPVIPNVGLDELDCPRDVPDCASDPARNASGQTLLDANLLKLRITYGIAPRKQMPMLGRFYTWALDKLGAAQGDAFKQALLDAGRIPVVTHTVMRMQSDAIRNAAMASLPGPGNGGVPHDPGPGQGGGELPTCPWWDPGCISCPDGVGGDGCRPASSCNPATDPGGCRPAGCAEGDPSCDPRCGTDYCCVSAS